MKISKRNLFNAKKLKLIRYFSSNIFRVLLKKNIKKSTFFGGNGFLETSTFELLGFQTIIKSRISQFFGDDF